MRTLRIVLIKPSKYDHDGFVQRYHSGLMPNATLSHIASLTPSSIDGHAIEINYVDEYVRTNLDYLTALTPSSNEIVLLALVGVQSHQFHRAIDIASYASVNNVQHIVIGGPHPMTCDTSELHHRGISFSLAEAEVVWIDILHDAIRGQLEPTYGEGRRWATTITDSAFVPPPKSEIDRHWVPMVGYYPVRGCPFVCNFCSVIKIAGRQVRNPSVDAIISALKVIESAGVEFVVFTSDNFNKFPAAREMLTAMIDERINLRFWFQADTQIVKQEELVRLIGRAGGAEMFIGVESFVDSDLKNVQKRHNQPKTYSELIRLCRESGIRAHFSNIFGFPEQTEQDVYKHLEVLKNYGPEFASFYILTPIPGTEQYDEYLSKGLIFEKNLDRFDAHTPTFRHEHLDPKNLQRLLFVAYEDFYKDAMSKHRVRMDIETRNYMVFCRWSASRKMHPMSSGIGQQKIDSSKDYLEYRKQVLNVGPLLDLPTSLQLSPSDEKKNKSANWSTKIA